MNHRFDAPKYCAAAMTLLLLINGIRFSPLLGDERLLFGLDDGRMLSTDWSAVGKISARREPGPDTDPTLKSGPSGNAVWVETEGSAGLYAKSGTIPADWKQFDHVIFWLHRSKEEAEQRKESVMEVQVYEPEGRARFWRKITLSHTGWKEFRLPLKWFRWGTGKRPAWDRIDRMGFWFRDAATVSIDTISVQDDGRNAAAYLSNDELLELAFSGSSSKGRLSEADHVTLLTNASGLDDAALVEHLSKVAGAVRKQCPFLVNPDRRPILIVFATRQQYEEFPPRIAQRFNSSAARPLSTGFTFHGIATSFVNEEKPELRPTFSHEFVHSYLAQAARIPNSGEWLHEGMASLCQLQFHPQENLRQIVQEGVEREGYRSPLSELCNGKPIPSNRYWQAATFVEMLQSDPYQDRWPLVFQALQDAKTTDLQPHLETVLKTNWPTVTDDWINFCQARYVSRPTKTE